MTTKIKSGVISDNAITSAHISSGAISSAHLSSIDTDAVSEGSSNLYFTTARARTSFSITDSGGDGSLAYDNSTGVITYTGPSASEVRAHISVTDSGGDGSLAYSNGVITYTGPSASEVRAHLSAGTGVTYSSGEISIGQSVATSASPTFADINITGDLNLTGDINSYSVTDLDIVDQTITLGVGQNEAASDGSGIVIAGSSASILWDEPNDEFDFNKGINVTGTITASGNITGTLATAAQPNITSLGTLTSLNTSGSVTMNKSVASGNFLTDATIYPLRLTNDDTTAGNAVAMTFGQGGFDFTNFIASVRTGTGDNPKGDLVFGGRPSDGSPFVERMRIEAGGDIGIGTDSPDTKLHVFKATAGTITDYANNALIVENSTDVGISLLTPNGAAGHLMFGSPGHQYHSYIRGEYGASTTSTLEFYTDGVNTMTHKAGKVGIGTDNPNKELHLLSSSINKPMIKIESTGTNSYPGFQIVNDAQTWEVSTHGAHSDALTFYNGSTHTFALATNGNVGIGTNQPSKALDISNTTSAKINLQGGTNQNGISFAAAGNGGVSSSQYYLGVGSGLMGNDYGAVLLDVTNNRSVLFDDQSNSRLGFYNNSMVIDSSGNVGIGAAPTNFSNYNNLDVRSKNTSGGAIIGIHDTDGVRVGCISHSEASPAFDIEAFNSNPMRFFTNGDERLKIASDGLAYFTSTRNEWAMRLNSAGSRAGIVLDKPGTSTIMGSALMLSADETFRLGTASNYHIKMDQSGNTYFGNSTNNSFFNSSGNQYFEQAGQIAFESAANDYSNIFESIGYASQSYGTTSRYWNHLRSKGGTHITINTDGGHTGSENNYDDFVIWQGTQDTAEPLFRVSNTGRVIAKQNYEIGYHKTNREEFGVNAINTVDTATSDINTTTTNTYENRPGVYWLNFNSKRFRAFIKPNWLQQRNWVLAAKFFSHMDMPSGSSLWTNDASWNGGDFDLNNGHFAKYGNVWRYFGFNRLAMQMGDRVAPIMQFSSTQTLYGAFSGGRAANGGGVSPSSTDPALSTGATYHGMTNYIGPGFTDLGGLEDKMQSYGLNKWAAASSNSTSGSNQGSRDLTAGGKGYELTIEDSHPNTAGMDSIGFAGAWIGCPMDEGNCNPLATTSNGGADSGFGFGGGCGNNARTWTSGIAEWARGNEVANYLPGYIWLSID